MTGMKNLFITGTVKTIVALAVLTSAGILPSYSQTTHHTDTLKSQLSDTLNIEATIVSARKNSVVYRLDRKKIDGNADISASGGSAADILSSMPSVRTDADGEISFRGSTGFLVYVNGKPAITEGTQALKQIPAYEVEDIEIITSPSARYKTDGEAGIINIKTTKPLDQGFGGSISASGSTIGSWNGNILLNWNKGSQRFYIEGSGSQQKQKSRFGQTKSTLVDNYATTSDANGHRFSAVTSYIGKAGWELSNDSHYAHIEIQAGISDNARGGDMKYHEKRFIEHNPLSDNTFDSYDRYSNEKHLAQIAAEYRYILNQRGDNISAEGRLRYDWYALEYTESNMFLPDGTRYEGTRGYEDEHHWDYDWDLRYEMKYRPQGRFEAGAQMTSYSESGDYSLKYWDREDKSFLWDEDMYAPFFYRRQIFSLYAMVTEKFGPLSIDAGLRGDLTRDIMEISVKDASRNLTRTELFPSIHLSYRAPEDNTISAGYSYRTSRPGIWKLEPYITYEDYYTRLIGNPDIKPEYIHSAEIGYRKVFGKNRDNISLTGFFRRKKGTTDLIRKPYSPGVTLDSLINAGNDLTFGLEAEAGIKAAKWWNIRLAGSIMEYKFKSTSETGRNISGTSYTASMINNFTVARHTAIQFDANAVGPAFLSQGNEKGYFYFDLAVRQKLLKERLALSLAFHDTFHTAHYMKTRNIEGLTSVTDIRPVYPCITLSLSYSFNIKPGKEASGAISAGASFEGKDF